MSEYRAVLVSLEHRKALANAGSYESVKEWEAEVAVADAFDAAGDRSRTRWCVPHGRVASNANGTLCPKTSGTNPCRVVDAIVVPLPEQT